MLVERSQVIENVDLYLTYLLYSVIIVSNIGTTREVYGSELALPEFKNLS